MLFSTHLTLGIVLGYVMLTFSCSDIELFTTKLLTHSCCTDVNAIEGLDLCSYRVSRVLATFMYYAAQHLLTPRCSFYRKVDHLMP